MKPQLTRYKASATGDPHFRINFDDKDDICFDFGSTEGQIVNLLADQDSGLVVNGELIDSKDHKAHRLGRIGIISPMGNTLQVSRENIVGSGPSGNISFSQGPEFYRFPKASMKTLEKLRSSCSYSVW